MITIAIVSKRYRAYKDFCLKLILNDTTANYDKATGTLEIKDKSIYWVGDLDSCRGLDFDYFLLLVGCYEIEDYSQIIERFEKTNTKLITTNQLIKLIEQ